METYTLLSGEVIEYEAEPALADFLARVRVAANDPTAGLNELISLIYGTENPLLEQGVFEGRGMVTKATFGNPAYHVMLDLIDQKRIQSGELEPSKALAAYTMTVADAASRLGISTGAIRQAIAGGKIAAEKVRGAWRLLPSSVEAYASTPKRGPVGRGILDGTIGNLHGCSLSLITDGEFVEVSRDGKALSGHVDAWEYGAVKIVNKENNRLDFYDFISDPDDVAITQLDSNCGLKIRGRIYLLRHFGTREFELSNEARARAEMPGVQASVVAEAFRGAQAFASLSKHRESMWLENRDGRVEFTGVRVLFVDRRIYFGGITRGDLMGDLFVGYDDKRYRVRRVGMHLNDDELGTMAGVELVD